MNSEQCNTSRIGWVKQEEDYLRFLYEKENIRSWKQISKKINSKFQGIRRTPKQCRERYTNYVKFSIEEGQLKVWSQQDDVKLFHKYMQVGSKWVQICKTIKGRSQNFLKNKFYGSLRKVLRRVNRVQKLNKMKKYKPIKFDSLLKILESSGQTSNDVYIDPILKISYQNFVQKMKSDILQMAIASENSTSDNQILQLINRIHRFNSVTRFFNITRQRKSKTMKRRTLPPFVKRTKVQSISSQQTLQKYQQIQDEENQGERNSIQIQDLPEELQQQFKHILENIHSCLEKKLNNKDLQQEVNIILQGNNFDPINHTNCESI